MTIKELKEIIENEELEFHCQLELGNKPDGDDELGLYYENTKWNLFRTGERGGCNIFASFGNESDACERLLNALRMEKRREMWQLKYEDKSNRRRT